MTLQTYYKYYSQKRFLRYLESVNSDVAKAARLYDLQEKLSGEMHALLARFEVVARNQIDQYMRENYDENWLLALGTKNSVLNCRNTYSSFAMLKDAIDTLQRKGDFDHDDIVATVYFGYWTSLLQPKQLKKLNNMPAKAFIMAPNLANISHIIHIKFNRCRQMRNQIAHLEPVIFHQGNSEIDFKQLDMSIKNVIDLSRWLDINTAIYDLNLTNINALKSQIEKLTK